MKQVSKTKTLLLGLLLVAMVGSGSGCAAGKVLATVANAIKAEGRSYGHTYTYAQEETATTAFFSYSIQSASLATELNGYVPNDPTHRFLIVTITVENTFADDTKIPMFYDDFELTWAQLDDAAIYAEMAFTDSQLPDEYELLFGDSLTGDLVYVVPKAARDFSISFQEYWEDDFLGDRHVINFTVG